MVSIEQLASKILKDALKRNATDIHIVPRKSDTLIQFRIANKIVPHYYLPKEDCERLISHFKFTANMDIGEKRRPQSGSFSIVKDGMEIGFRLSTLPLNQLESLVIRILPSTEQIPLSKLSLFPNMNNKLISLLQYANGLLLFTGPTGSGKTTTLFSLLRGSPHLHYRNIITLEDPIEKESDFALQVQVNEKAGVTYTTGLKAILRHDPDIIIVGEIRDGETARIAVRAALTGHLVLSTMHTRDAKGAIYRLLEFGVSHQEIEQTLVGVVAQRLVELTCPFCQNKCSPHCYTYSKFKRASVFEILTGENLMNLLRGKGEISYKTLKDVIAKGIALGFIKESEYERWVFHDEKT